METTFVENATNSDLYDVTIKRKLETSDSFDFVIPTETEFTVGWVAQTTTATITSKHNRGGNTKVTVPAMPEPVTVDEPEVVDEQGDETTEAVDDEAGAVDDEAEADDDEADADETEDETETETDDKTAEADGTNDNATTVTPTTTDGQVKDDGAAHFVKAASVLSMAVLTLATI